MKTDYERKKTLHEKGVTSAKDFQMAQSRFRSTTSALSGLKAKIQLLGINVNSVAKGQIFSSVPITSPIAGYVDEVVVSLGDYVPPQSKMFTVSDNSEIHADFKVYEKDVSKVKKGQVIYFTVANKPDRILEAKIHAIGKTFENDPKALHVHADVHNDDKTLLPGMYVEGRIAQGEKMAMTVPEDAVVKDGAASFIFIVEKHTDKEFTFKKIPIIVSNEDLGFVEISLPAGIPNDVKIVTKGAYTLSSEMIKGELSHEH